MKGTHQLVLAGAALLVASLTVGSTPALAQFTGPTPLSLINGWTNAPFGTSLATVEEVSGIVQLRGRHCHGRDQPTAVRVAILR